MLNQIPDIPSCLNFDKKDNEDGECSLPCFIIWVIIGAFCFFADMNLEIKIVIQNPRQRPTRLNGMAALVSLMANFTFKPAPSIAPDKRPAMGIK